MKLIDADELISYLSDWALQEAPFADEPISDTYNTIDDCIKAVEEHPVVYNVEKVIEQVKKIYSCDSCDLPKKFECSPGHCVIAEVIEVIKNGGSME